MKKYKENMQKSFVETLKMSVDSFTRKQVQMHAVVRNLAYKFSRKVTDAFGQSFRYEKVYYAKYDENTTVTFEVFVDGKCVNSDGITPDFKSDDLKIICKKSETFCNFTYEATNRVDGPQYLRRRKFFFF